MMEEARILLIGQQATEATAAAHMRRRVMALAWPVMAEMALQTFTQMVDMAMVGRLGHVAIASVGISFRPLFIGHALFLGLGTAATAMVARYTGARDEEQANAAAEQALLSSLGIALAFGAFIFFFAPSITTLMGGTAEVIPQSAQYMRGMAPGMVSLLMATMITSSLRGAGDTRTPMLVNISSNVFNILANYTLIFGHFGFPRLEVYGAGIATSSARVLALAVLLYISLRGNKVIRMRLNRLVRPDWDLIRRLFAIGLPAAAERLVLSIGLAIHLRLVAGLGTLAIASATLAGNIEQLSFMPALGFSIAASALVGQGLGAQDPERARLATRESARLASAFMGIMGILFLAFPGLLVRLFTDDPQLLGPSITLVRLVAFAQIPTALAQVFSGALRGAGDTTSVLSITLSGTLVARLALTFLLINLLGLGLWAAWAAVIVDWVLRAYLAYRTFNRGRWQQVRV